MREIKRHNYGTARGAVRFFCDARLQGFSPSLIAVAGGFEVIVWEVL